MDRNAFLSSKTLAADKGEDGVSRARSPPSPTPSTGLQHVLPSLDLPEIKHTCTSSNPLRSTIRTQRSATGPGPDEAPVQSSCPYRTGSTWRRGRSNNVTAPLPTKASPAGQRSRCGAVTPRFAPTSTKLNADRREQAAALDEEGGGAHLSWRRRPSRLRTPLWLVIICLNPVILKTYLTIVTCHVNYLSKF